MTRSHDLAARSQAAAFDFAKLWLEAGTVIALRSWGMGRSPGRRGEDRRMIDEKAPAFASAALAAWQASVLSAWLAPFDPGRVAFAGVAAWTRSLNRKARSNRRRLTRPARR